MSEGLVPDSAVLGRILLLHGSLQTASDTDGLVEMAVRALAHLPGVGECKACVDGKIVRVPHSNAPAECFECPNAMHGFKSATVGCPPGCPPDGEAKWLTLELGTTQRQYGAIYLRVEHREAVAPYVTFANATANLVALHIENARTTVELGALTRDLDQQVRKRTHQLRATQERLSEAQRIARMGSFESDLDGNIVWWSDHLYHLYGLNPTQFTPTREAFMALVHPDDAQKTIESIKRCVETGQVVQSEYRARYSDGSWLHFESIASPLLDQHGRIKGLRGSTQDITQRKRIEASLRESNQRFSQISDYIDDILWLFDVEDSDNIKRLFTSSAYERIFQRPLADIYENPMAWLDYVHPDDRARVVGDFGEFIRGTGELTYEYRNIRPDGTVRTLNTVGRLIRTEQGKIVRAAGITRDVTERKLHEAFRIGQSLVLEQMVTGDPLHSVLNTLVQTIELQADGMLGAIHLLKNEDGLRLYSGAAPNIPAAYTKAIEGAKIGPSTGSCGTAAYFNKRVIVEDIQSDPLWANYRDLAAQHGLRACWSQPITNSLGDVLGTFALYYHKPKLPTDRELDLIYSFAHLTALAIEREQSEEALRKSERENRALVENAPYCIHQVDTKGRIISMNSAGITMMNASSERDVVGVDYLDAVSEEDKARIEERLLAALDGHASEFEFNAANGCCFASTFVPLFGDRGKVTRLIGITQDVTQRKRDEKERLELEAQLFQSQKMEAIGQLAGGVAHDFNNLLTAILGNTEILLLDLENSTGADANARLRAGLGEIQAAGNHAASLTQKLLAFSRREVLRPELIDPNTIVQDMRTLLCRLIGEHIEMDVQSDPDVSLIHVDPGQLEQVIMNLVVNAADAMPDGGRLMIQVDDVELHHIPVADFKDAKPGRYVQLAVTDDGMGMSQETLEHVFEPFFTTKPVGKGTGLGLSTVYGVLKQSNGFIQVESKPEAGTTFRACFPAFDRKELPPKLEELSESGVLDANIVVCEDEHMVRSVMCKALRTAGFSVTETESGREALEAASSHEGPIDLLITDVVMPGMSGNELAEELQKQHPNARVLFVSGYSADHLDTQGVERGSTQLLQKPFGPTVLLERVRQILGTAGETEQQ